MNNSLAPLLTIDEMPTLPGLSVPRDLHVVVATPALLAGMPATSATPARLNALHDAGFRHLVRLTGVTAAYDPAPRHVARAARLTDLVGGGPPPDPLGEATAIRAAVDVVVDLVRRGEGVVVHCAGGRGPTGTVLGGALVRLGHDPARVVAYLDDLHRQRGKPGWPESRWQAHVVHSSADRADRPLGSAGAT